MLTPHIAQDEPTTGQENQKRFVLHSYIFHLYLIIDKNTEKGMYLAFLMQQLIFYNFFCEYPISLKLLLNILYPNSFFFKYPISR